MQNLNLNNIYDWPNKYKLCIYGFVFFAVIFLDYLWDISAFNEELTAVTNKENEIKQQISGAIHKQAEVQASTANFIQIKNLLTDWKSKLITYQHLPEMLNEILKIGANNQLNFLLFDPEQEVKEGGYLKVNIKAKVVGSYHQIAGFLSQLANFNELIKIGDFKINSDTKNKAVKNPLTADINLLIYYLPEGRA